MNMIRKNTSVDPSRIPLPNAPNHQVGGKGPGPVAPVHQTPNANRTMTPPAEQVRTGSKTSVPTTTTRTGTTKPRSKTETSAPRSGSSKTAARREAHTGHALVAPEGREHGGKGSGGFHGQGHMDVQDWVPFSAQQSRILRATRATPGMGATKMTAHSDHALKNHVLTMAKRIYSEVLPSLFRQTPRQAERNDNQVRKEIMRKDIQRKQNKQRTDRNAARRESFVKRTEVGKRHVMAGDLSTAFAMS